MTSPTQQYNSIVVCGPTASGKTRLGVVIALHVDGEIVSVDSRQIYRGMDIGTGKDLGEYRVDQRQVPYHLIDIAEPHQIYTLWNYQEDFYRVFREIHHRQKTPVIVGGTGLYLEAVIKHYQIANVPEDVSLRDRFMKEPKEDLERQLKAISPEIFGKTDRSSKKRIVRALEIAHYAHDHPVEWGHTNPPQIRPLVLVIRIPREHLRARIEHRLDQRLKEGMIDEVRGLMRAGVSRDRLNLFGLEYRHVARHLAGEIDFETMRYDLLHAIFQFAKRQDTWFRGMERRGIPVHWIDPDDWNGICDILQNTNFSFQTGRGKIY